MATSSGALYVDKPSGLTSHDVISRLRRVLHERRIGHAGTLDPMATGLLVVAVGSATRLLRFATATEKRYEGVVQLGVATDSLDADGAVVATAPVPSLTASRASELATAMVGPQLQTPPMVSAKKVGGRRLYDLAREGQEVERSAVAVTIGAFTVAATDDPTRWTFDVTCSAGTYVRVLVAEWAAAAGTVGHLVALRRVRSGAATVDDAWTLERLTAAHEAGDEVLLSPTALVSQLAVVALDDAMVRDVRHGRPVGQATGDDEVAALDPAGELVAVLKRRDGQWWPLVVLAEG